MQYKPASWITGFKRSPRAANVQHRDMGLFLNSSGKFETIDDSWDNLHSGGMFISDDNKIYFRDETNKDIYINSPADNQLALYASSGVGINCTPRGPLDVVDTSTGNPDVLTIQSAYNATGDGPAIRFDEDNSSNWTLARIIAREQTSYAGYLSFQTNVGGSASNTTTEKMRIDKDGAITAPLQPAFLAKPASAQNNIAIDTTTIIVFGTEMFDQGSDFASNTFTAPVTGKYQLSAIVRLENLDSAADNYQVYINTSNNNYYTIMAPDQFAGDLTFWSIQLSILADMDANDTAIVNYYQSGGSAQTDISVNSRFSGFLAC
jgi:hypothetical protein